MGQSSSRKLRRSTNRSGAPARRRNGNEFPGELRSGDVMRYYETMSGALGPMHWWPAETPFEALLKDPVEAACVSAVTVLEAKLK